MLPAIRATPKGSEGMGFSLMMSVRNLALGGTDWIGAKLLEDYHVPFNGLVISNSLTTLIAVPLIFLLPRLLISKNDRVDLRRRSRASHRHSAIVP